MRNWLPILVALTIFSSFARATPLVVLDSGHEPSRPGAIASCGRTEAQYNDDAVQAIAARLTGLRVELTRAPGTEIDSRWLDDTVLLPALNGENLDSIQSNRRLFARAAIANTEQANLFISIHHDSVAERFQIYDPMLCGAHGGSRLVPAFKAAIQVGFNIFLHEGGPENRERFQASMRLARLVSRNLRAAGLKPSTYHRAPSDDCKSCRAIDEAGGIWFQNLAILRNTQMPSLLIEAENIADPEFEAIASSPQFRATFAKAVADAIQEYLHSQSP